MIRFKQPAHDINIQCDPLQLKSFLHILNVVAMGKINLAVMHLSNLSPKAMKSVPKTKIIIKDVAKYPILEGFPRTAKELYLVGLRRKSFDRQILKLQNLIVLNLTENQLTSLPQELGELPCLQELHLSNNQLGKKPVSKWSWICGNKITKNLRLLNLNSNKVYIYIFFFQYILFPDLNSLRIPTDFNSSLSDLQIAWFGFLIFKRQFYP